MNMKRLIQNRLTWLCTFLLLHHHLHHQHHHHHLLLLLHFLIFPIPEEWYDTAVNSWPSQLILPTGLGYFLSRNATSRSDQLLNL